jgi:hypothetical protein
MKKVVPGALAGLIAAALLAAPALAAPANVTVRVEGQHQTLLPRTAVATDTRPVLVEGANACPGTSAGGALYKAVGGAVGGTWGGFGYQVKTVKGETHADVADPSYYWSFWVNYEFQNQGMCATELQEGDDVIVLVDCFTSTNACEPAQPLRLSNVPPTVRPGQSVAVRVDEYGVDDPAQFPAVTVSRPAAGATVTAGGQSATTGADGTATLTFPAAGPVTIAVTKPDRIRTAGITCVTTGTDGSCGTLVPAGTPLGTGDPDDKTAPVAAFTGLAKGKVFGRKRAPRTLKGTVSADPSGLKSVRLSILRRNKGRCWAFDGASERFERHRCGGSRSFRIGDRANWSYLLPKRLPKGRYTIRVAAIDKAGNDAATTTRIRVR